MKPLLIYISGPTPEKKDRWEEALEAIKIGIKICTKGHYPIIPHLYDSFDEVAKILGYDFDWQKYADLRMAIMERCDALYAIDNKSPELEVAQKKGMKIYRSVNEIDGIRKTTESYYVIKFNSGTYYDGSRTSTSMLGSAKKYLDKNKAEEKAVEISKGWTPAKVVQIEMRVVEGGS